MKEKELVTLRSKKLATGSKSLFLDYSIDGIRYKEYLKMYLVPERTKMDKWQNAETLKIAQAAKSKKILEIQSGKINIRRIGSKPDVLLKDYIEQQSREYLERGHDSYGAHLTKLAAWVGKYHKRVSLRTADKNWVIGFVDFMKEGGLADSTTHNYFSELNTMFNKAYRAELIAENPITRMETSERPQRPETEREYLTIDEVKKLMDTPCKNEAVKKAFLFACFTGLRLSDIEQMTWSNIKPTSEGGMQVEARQKKTKRIVAIPLSENAIKMLPKRYPNNKYVWIDLPMRQDITYIIRKWVKDAGIEKHITFHCSRHTNATLLLTYGADIYTVMALLGHTDVATTQIYAKVVNSKKIEAVRMIPTIG